VGHRSRERAGLYEEQLAQWVAEKSFFRRFLLSERAKGKKKGDQLVDGIVLFGDVMLSSKSRRRSDLPNEMIG